MGHIEDTDEYTHLVARGVPDDAAWSAVWVDRAYAELLRRGVDGARAYAQAVSTYLAASLDINRITPERIIATAVDGGMEAMEEFSKLDPNFPEASKLAGYKPPDHAESAK